jgi:hypothetical protein
LPDVTVPKRREPVVAHKTFRDSSGREWQVWPVSVAYLERRTNLSAGPPQGRERRRRVSFRQRVSEPWSGGWLAFETKGEKRRLAPYPTDWSQRSDAELEALCRAAVKVRPSRRLIE